MMSGFSVFLNSQVSIVYNSLMEAGGRQTLAPGGTARSALRLSYWLVALVLGLISASGAQAARDDGLRVDVREPVKSDLAKVPKPYPANFPIWGSGALGGFQVQPLTTNSDPGPAAMGPGTTPLSDETLVTDAARPRLEPSAPNQAASPTLPATAIGPAMEVGLPGSASWEEASATDLTDLSLVNGVDRSSGDGFAQADGRAQAASSADEMPWQFNVEPFLYLPFGANGDITVRDINVPFNAGIGDIFDAIVNDLNFAAFGRVEAWNGPWGIFFSGAYMNLGTGQTADIPVPPDLQQAGLPPQVSIDAAAGTSFVQLDLGGAYRFGDGNLPTALSTADSEFDLGPFILDAMVGVRLYSFNNELVLTSDLGNRFEFSQSNTIVEPMIGGRARWNLSHNLAALANANMSGFGIGDLTFSAAGSAGIDWLFSGNTSLLATYGFTYLNYSSGSSGLDLFTHGPRIGVKFRF